MPAWHAVAVAIVLAGCSTPVRVQVSSATNRQPIPGALVERQRPANRWEKITNPVGTFYHPRLTVESRWTDTMGRCTLRKISTEDSYSVVTTATGSLLLALGAESIPLHPGPEQLAESHYHINRNNTRWSVTVAKPWWNWKLHKPVETMQPAARPE